MKIIQISLISFILFSMACLPAHAEIVCRAHDGDTFTLCDGRSIRIACINTPEVKKDKRPAQPGADMARDYLRGRLIGQDVQTEQYGLSWRREVSGVWLDGVDIGEEMIQRGYAQPVTSFRYCRIRL